MDKENWIDDQNLIFSDWENSIFSSKGLTVQILRLDLLHPIVSGNKWIKLKGYIKQMQLQHKSGIITQGGPWSNHIVAVAATCQHLGVQSAAILRGKKTLTASLEEAQLYGMEMIWVDWNDYDNVIIHNILAAQKNQLFVPMGGLGQLGANGFKEMMQREMFRPYNHIVSSIGSGTMFSGIISGKNHQQKAIGISALRLRPSTLNNIKTLSFNNLLNDVFITDRFIGNGYAKPDTGLIEWMNHFYQRTKIATDMVYTAKTFRAVESLAQENYFARGDKILVIHSGGLQGNRSLPLGTLVF